ncbi:MAG: hypothetical protein Q4C80_04210 [Bacillota bacterium]|nr:hypothetical protein [Bacillota bacterium]
MITKAENDITLVRVNDGEAGPPGADGYSPSLSTGTSSDGSTTLTVTNKDGSTTTTLQDSIARVDAANAQTTAQEAENKADKNSTAIKKIETDMLTIGGNKVYYQPNQPEGAFKDGDTWYKTIVLNGIEYSSAMYVYDTTNGWVEKPLDASILRTGSITAREVASKAITAEEINVQSLESQLQTIGDKTKAHIDITGDSIKFANGNDSLGYASQTKTKFNYIEASTALVIGNYVFRLTPEGHLGIYLR